MRRRGEDHVGAARRRVAVDVDADHEVERLERRARGARSSASTRPGCRASVIIARIWPSPGVSISSAMHAAGSSPKTSGAPRTRLVQRPKRAPRPLPSPALRLGRGQRPHRAARPVEVAGDRVEDVDEPARGRPERLRRRADAAVDGGARRGRQLARDPPRDVGGDAGRRRDGLGREVARPAPRRRRRRRTCSPGVAEALVEDHVDEREEQQRVGPGPDPQVLVGELRAARAPRVDDDDLAAAVADRLRSGRARRAPSSASRSTPPGSRPSMSR